MSEYVILGSGQLGLAIMDELVADGKPVKLVNRSGRVNEKLPAGVMLETADATNSDEVARATAGAEVVFFCVQPAYHGRRQRALDAKSGFHDRRLAPASNRTSGAAVAIATT